MGLQVVVMGVSGSGKSTVGELLAHRLEVEFADGDDFHSAANRAKLQAGVPLTDADRRPWLDAIGGWLAERETTGAVVACSALKRRYRDVIRALAPDTELLYCEGDLELITGRLANRSDHFMPASLLESQFAELEPPGADEDAVAEHVARPPEAIIDGFLTQVLRRRAEESRRKFGRTSFLA